MRNDRNNDVGRFIGEYASTELEAGVATVEEQFDRDGREGRPDVRRL